MLAAFGAEQIPSYGIADIAPDGHRNRLLIHGSARYGEGAGVPRFANFIVKSAPRPDP